MATESKRAPKEMHDVERDGSGDVLQIFNSRMQEGR